MQQPSLHALPSSDTNALCHIVLNGRIFNEAPDVPKQLCGAVRRILCKRRSVLGTKSLLHVGYLRMHLLGHGKCEQWGQAKGDVLHGSYLSTWRLIYRLSPVFVAADAVRRGLRAAGRGRRRPPAPRLKWGPRASAALPHTPAQTPAPRGPPSLPPFLVPPPHHPLRLY